MDVQQLDTIVRVAGVTLLLLLAAMLVRDDRSRRLAAWFAPLAICFSGFLIGNTPDPSLRLHGPIGAGAHLISGYTVVFLWWFCLASFDEAFKPSRAVLAVGVTWLLIASADRGLFGPRFADKGLSWLLVAIGFGIIGHLAWRLIRDRGGDLVEGRRAARVLVVGLLAGQLFVELTKEVAFGIDWRPLPYTIAQNGAVLAFALWLLALLLRASTAPLTAGRGVTLDPLLERPSPRDRDSDSEAKLIERLRRLVEVERLHLDPEVSFDVFVRKIGAPARVVRRVINHRLGYDHFRAFLNSYRMAEARRLLADPDRAGDKLIAIAFDSGFASLASFNRAFREFEGCAPSQYRAAAMRKPSISSLNTAFEERSVRVLRSAALTSSANP